MAEQILKTRIALRINDYTYWSKLEGVAEPANKVPGEGTNGFYVPYRGEVCFCEIPENNATATTAPTVLFKVGNGTDYFKDLKWASALAADVYDWAKKNEVKVEGDGNAVTNALIKDGYLTFEKGETFATKAELDRISGTIEADTNTTYQFSIPTEGTDAGKLLVEKKEVDDDDWTRVDAFDFVTPGELTAILGNYYTKTQVDELIEAVEGKIPTEVGVMSVGAGNAIEITGTAGAPVVNVKLAETQGNVALTVDGGLKAEIAEDTIKAVKVANAGHADKADEAEEAAKVANALTIKLAEGNEVVFDGSEAKTADVAAVIAGRLNGITYTDTKIDELIEAAKKHADDNDANTAHTHSAGDGLKKTGNGGIDGDVKYELNVAMKLEEGDIVIYDKDTENEVARLDAAELLEDSYLNDVEIVDNELKFTWKMDDGSTKTDSVDLKHLVDVYTGTENEYIAVSVADYKISAVLQKVDTAIIEDGAVTEEKLEQNVQDALALARTALQAHQDITGKADKVDGAVAGNLAALDADGNLVDSGKKADDFDAAGAAADAEQNAKNYAYDLVKDYGDIVTHNAAEFATNAENGAKALADANKARLDEITDEETGILAEAKKDAGDKAAVVLGEAQKYADQKVAALAGEGNDTTVAELAGKVKDLEDAKHISEVEADTGLRVIPGTKGANNKVAIDTETVFILDCNW